VRILITGSRDWPDDGSVGRAIQAAMTNPVPHLTATIVHGDAVGADTWAKQYAEAQAPWIDAEAHPVTSANVRLQGKRAYFLRNKLMVDLGADICLAFIMPCSKPEHADQPPHDSHGSKMTVDLAMNAGITVKEYRP